MFPRARRLFSVHGIDVRVDPSWVVIALLAVWWFAQRFELAYGHGRGAAFAAGAVAAVLFFGSILAHELGHAFEARHRDLEVGGITLFLFGGVTETQAAERRPSDAFGLAAIGPYVSLVLAAGFGLVAVGVDAVAPSLRVVTEVAGLLGWLNLALAVFNLLPGAPLDGGQVLRAVLWAVTGDRDRSTRLAARAGQVLAVALFGVGVWMFARAPGRALGAVWLVLIAWLLFDGARQWLRQPQAEESTSPAPAVTRVETGG